VKRILVNLAAAAAAIALILGWGWLYGRLGTWGQ